MTRNTIFALATPMVKSGVAIIRISGENAAKALEKFDIFESLEPRKAHFRELKCQNEVIDHVLLLWFPAPHSFTGENILEIQAHGSKAVLTEIIKCLSEIPDFRLAEAGEFAKRAFLNGKMDLTQAEGLADLIDAETSMQHRQAIRQMSGVLKNLYESWRAKLLKIMSLLEAYIDFPDEEIPADITKDIEEEIELLKNSINSHILNSSSGEIIREGLYIPIIGAPNVGKSSLINHLSRRNVAIVSEIAGTTRDVIEVHMEIAGISVTLADTAGIRESEDVIERAGIEKAKLSVANSDLKIIIFESGKIKKQMKDIASHIDENAIILINKIDHMNFSEAETAGLANVIPISIKENSGLDRFMEILKAKILDLVNPSADPVMTRARHRVNLEHCLENLMLFSMEKEIILAAEDVRMAARSLGQITGKIDVEEILGEIFSNFCIGK